MMKEILFLFLLDYSGSMYQTFDRKVKYETVQNNVNGLTAAADPRSRTSAFIFGTETKKACDDIKLIETTTPKFSKILSDMKPDKFGQTPLAGALRKGIDYSLKNNVKHIVTITDGADSCNQDPCQELVNANAKLKSANKKIKLLLVGYDISKESSKFTCFKNLKLDSITIDFVSASNGFQLQQKLRDLAAQLQKESLLAQAKDSKQKNDKSKNNSSNKQQSSASSSAKDETQGDSSLEVLGAPAEVRFTAKSTSLTKTWFGAFPALLEAGSYVIQANDPRTQALQITLEKGQRLTKSWADFFSVPKGDLRFVSTALSYEWLPTAQTKATHSIAESFMTIGQLDNKPTSQQVLFGEWNVKLISPPWLKGLIPEKRVLIEPMSAQDFNGGEIEQLVWEKSPNSQKSWVLEIDLNGRIERHYLQPGVATIPVTRDMKVRWLSGDEGAAPAPAKE